MIFSFFLCHGMSAFDVPGHLCQLPLVVNDFEVLDVVTDVSGAT